MPQKKILVVRNDKLGDFMLAWPSFAMLKLSTPDYHVCALVPPYTAELANHCPYIDQVIVDDKLPDTLHSIRQQHFDAAINLFSNQYNALLVWKAKIPYRLAPATKIIQFLYNHRLKQRRSKSQQPEYQYNLDLIRYFLNSHHLSIVEPQPPYLSFTSDQIYSQRQKLIKQLDLSPHQQWVFIHAGSGGSATNLSLTQYAQLIIQLSQQLDCQFVLTAGPNEEENAYKLCQLTQLPQERIKVYSKNDGLMDFAQSLACSQLFISGSTGPLHLAAALNKLTIGFFPSKRSASALRWQPINQSDRHLAFSPPVGYAENIEMQTIDITQTTQQIVSFALKHWQSS